jgi:hypothetical protein
MIILGIAVPAMIFLAIMQLVGWRMPTFGGLAAGISYIAPSTNKIILFAPTNSKNYFAGIGGNYDVLVNPWRNFLTERNLSHKFITEAAQLKKLDEGVLILPSALSLSNEDRAEITAFRARGGSILTTWATGTRRSGGDWDGWQFLDDLGTKFVGEMPADADANHLILNGESPVSHTLPAGQRIFMTKTSESLLRFKGERVAGRFMNWARIPSEERRDEGAVVFSESSSRLGRVVSFAFAETAWEARPTVMHSLISDSIRWLQREPVVIKTAWPSGKRAAQVIEMDTEQGFPNALNFASMMQAVDYPTTFYVLTSVGKTFPDILSKLARESEVGFHGDIHTSFKDQAPALQEQRLQTMRSEMASVVPDMSKMTGFRAPTEGYDATTEAFIQKLGIRYHVADPNRTEARLPIIAKMDDVEPADKLIVLPRTQRDDINLYWEKLSVEQTTKALIDDAELTLESGAMGLLSVHTQNFNTDGVLYKAMPGYLVHLKQRRDQMWLASAGQVADWWRERERFSASSQLFGRRVEFNMSVKGKQPTKDASMIIMLPQKDVLPTITATKVGGLKPTITKIDAYRAAITFNALPAGNHAYQATFAQ